MVSSLPQPVKRTSQKLSQRNEASFFGIVLSLSQPVKPTSQRLSQRRELSAKLTERAAVHVLFHTTVAIDTRELQLISLLNIQIADIFGVFLDKFSARLYLLTHQQRENFICHRSIFDGNLQQCTVFRIHSSFPQLFRVHLT